MKSASKAWWTSRLVSVSMIAVGLGGRPDAAPRAEASGIPLALTSVLPAARSIAQSAWIHPGETQAGDQEAVADTARSSQAVHEIEDRESQPASPPRRRWDRKPRTVSVQKIEHALESMPELAFQDTPLTDVANFLSDVCQIRMLLDQKALSEQEIAADTAVTLTISNVRLENALNLMFEPLGLDYVIHNEVLLITTREMAASMVETRVYPIGDAIEIEMVELAELIRSTVNPDSWFAEDSGSHGRIQVTSRGIVIRQTQRCHAEICDLLDQLAAE